MVKVFFADGGSLEQLQTTLRAVAETADAQRSRLWESLEGALDPDSEFRDRVHLSSMAMRFHLQHEALVADWARWALAQTEGWSSTTDPAGWDHLRSLDGLERT